jgi:hypothetical protein
MSTALYLPGPKVNVIGETEPLQPAGPDVWFTVTVMSLGTPSELS